MKSKYQVVSILFICILISSFGQAEKYVVNSQATFDDALNNVGMNDSIIWESGTFADIYMDINESNLYIGASVLGGTVFNGESWVRIRGDYVTLEGVQFIGGNIGTKDVINTYGSYTHFNQINIRDYTCYKYLRIREESQYSKVTYCNFENRLNLDDQNILSILVDGNNPGYHKVQYCSFKNFDGTGNDLGIEPIRIGVSTQANFISRSLVEFCYFTQCNGDGELISSKATQNVYRYNTFENNPRAELVLRHGSEAIVYGNFFLKGKGGVRVREGQDHYIYNNYFYELDDRTIYLQNEDSDPLDNINIAFNTIVSCSEVLLGGSGNDKPTQVTFANNIFADPDDDLFEVATGTETWINNFTKGDLGIARPANGLTEIDPLLEENAEGYYGLAGNSPAIDAAASGFAPLPQFEGMDPIDVDVMLDLMGQDRPAAVNERDLGCNEFPHETLIQPIATEENTGPSYNTDVISSVQDELAQGKKWIQITPNPSSSNIRLKLDLQNSSSVQIDLYDMNGKKIKSLFKGDVPVGQQIIKRSISFLVSGHYSIRAQKIESGSNIRSTQSLQLIKQ